MGRGSWQFLTPAVIGRLRFPGGVPRGHLCGQTPADTGVASLGVGRMHEEKGSDVNVAAQLLIDVLGGAVEGALVISNDSDLRFPREQARLHMPVGVVNPHDPFPEGAA
jgi:hypothetical protein